MTQKLRAKANLNLNRSGGSRKCCLLSLVVFVLILGAAFGVVFGVIPVEEVRNWFGSGTGSGNGDGDGDSKGKDKSPTSAPTPAPFSFMQCPQKGECCNGLESNCKLRPDEILWPTVHNAMHHEFLGNNRAPLEDALEAGYRGLLLDVCWCENQDTKVNELVFCHSVCAAGKRYFDKVFPNINTFLNDNPSETILINFEISFGSPTPEEVWNEMSKFNGIPKKTYIHNGNQIPTMKELQQNGKQIILFKHNGVNCLDTSSAGCTPRITEFHKYALETEYQFPDTDSISNYPTSCPGTRGTTGTKDFYAINHFVTKVIGASKNAAEVINERSVLEARIQECEKITKLDTSMVSIDFWQEGDLLEVAQEINLARGKRRRSRSLRTRVLKWFS